MIENRNIEPERRLLLESSFRKLCLGESSEATARTAKVLIVRE